MTGDTTEGPTTTDAPTGESERPDDRRAPSPRRTPARTDGTHVPRPLEVGAAWGWRFVVVAAAAYVILLLVTRLRVVVIPVVIGAMLAALFGPAVQLLARWLPRLAAVWATLLVSLGALVGLGWLLTAPIVSATDDLRSQWDTAVDDVRDWAVDGPLGLEPSRVDGAFDRIGDGARSFASGFFDEPADLAMLAADILTGALLALVLTFFLLKDGPSMWRWTLSHVHEARRDAIDRGGRAAFGAIQGWIRGVAITGAVDALLIGIALLVLQVPGALPLAAITFFAAFFPIVGASLAGALAAAVALTTRGPGTAIAVAVVVLVVQQVEGDILLPIVMYRQVSLHPVVILVALAGGAAVAGIVGAIVAVPATAAVTAAVSAATRGDPEHEP